MSWFDGGGALPWYAPLIAAIPLAVFGLSTGLLGTTGLNFDPLPEYFAVFDVHRAEAGYLNAAAAFVLVSSVAVAAFLYFAYNLLELHWHWLVIILACFIAAGGALGWFVALRDQGEAKGFSNSAFVCTALSYGTQDLPIVEEKDRPAKVKITDARNKNGGCQGDAYLRLQRLLLWDQLAVLLGLLSVALGSVCCLADRGDDDAAPRSLGHYEAQSRRLNTYLYLSAFLLVTGLLFVAANLRWPSYALTSTASYEAHVNALTAYYGFTYTVLLASFYVPVALILTERVRRLKPASAPAGDLPEAFKGPLQILKIASAIFSTSLAGLLSGLMAMPG